MKNHRMLRDERRKSTWDSCPNSLDIIGQLVCTYAQQHERRILQCWMKQFAIKCLISQHQKQYWSPNSLHWLHQIDVATSNSLEQFQLVDSKFKLFAPVITQLCTFRTSYPSPISLYWNPKCLDLGAMESMMFGSNKFKYAFFCPFKVRCQWPSG